MSDNRTTPDGWIDVRDRLPEPTKGDGKNWTGEIVAYDAGENRVCVARLSVNPDSSTWWPLGDGGMLRNVTHWKPLPEPPVTL